MELKLVEEVHLNEASVKQRWLTSVYKSSPIGLCCFDKQLRYVDINEWLAALNGMSIEEHLGRTISEVLPDVAAGVELQLRRVIETGEPIINGEVAAETQANPGVKKHFLHNYFPLKSDKGDVVGISCAVQDITERRQAEQALEKAKVDLEDRVNERTKELQKLNEQLRLEMARRQKSENLIKIQRRELAHVSRVSTLGEVGAALAHELGQPLSAIQRNANAGRRLLDCDEPNLVELRDILTDIVRDDLRAVNVLERIRFHMQKSDQPFTSVDLNNVIEDCIVFLKVELATKQMDVQLQLAPELKPVQGDSIELQQVIINLLMNAEQAMKGQSELRKIAITTELDGNGNAKVAVIDNGPGIHERDVERVFQPFHTTKKDGMGMGLAINRAIINDHDGRIWVEKKGKRGAKFIFSIPTSRDTGNS